MITLQKYFWLPIHASETFYTPLYKLLLKNGIVVNRVGSFCMAVLI